MEEKIRNLTFIVILGFIIMFILIIGLYFKDGSSSQSNNSSQSSSSSQGSSSGSTDYDVSAMNEVDVDEALNLFEEEGTHVLYIGRSTCSVCVQFVPVLNEVQENMGFTTNYLPIETSSSKTWSDWQDELEPLTELLTVEASANGETGTLGELFLANGFTPALVVIQDGEVVEGFFGYRDAETLTSLLEDYLN